MTDIFNKKCGISHTVPIYELPDISICMDEYKKNYNEFKQIVEKLSIEINDETFEIELNAIYSLRKQLELMEWYLNMGGNLVQLPWE